MSLKFFFTILLFFTIGAIRCQTNTNSGAQSLGQATVGCMTELPKNYSSWKKGILNQLNVTQNLVNTLKHDTCLNKKFSIVFYLIQDSLFSLNNVTIPVVTSTLITPAVNTLNNVFKRICVQFENCSTVVIPNYEYNNWSQAQLEEIVTANWYTTKTINFFLVNTIMNNQNQAGYTYMPGTSGKKDLIVMRKNLLNTNSLLHLMGHFFGLPDTHAEINPVPPAIPGPPPGAVSQEYFDRTNCYTHGDGFCDTEADPYPLNFNNFNAPIPPCYFDYSPTDGLGKYYVPPVDNYMSDYRDICRCRYTQEQYNFMAYVILTARLYLH